MFYPLSTQLVGPTAQIKPDAVVQPLGHIRANTMPTLQQTIYGLEPLDEIKKSHRYEENRPQITISHPRMAPSSISAEEFFWLVLRFLQLITTIWLPLVKQERQTFKKIHHVSRSNRYYSN